MPLQLGVWSASVVPNGVLCMNLGNVGYIEKPELQFLMLELFLELASERPCNSENNN